MTTIIYSNEDMDSFYIICFLLDRRNVSALETTCVRILESVKPDSLLLQKKNKALLIPNIQRSIARLLSDVFSNIGQKKNGKYHDGCVGVRSNQKVKFSCQSSLVDVLTNRCISNRIKYILRYESFIDTHISEEITSDSQTLTDPSQTLADPSKTLADPEDCVISVKRQGKDEIQVKANYKSTNKKKHSEKNSGTFLQMKSYFQAVYLIQYKCQKQQPTVHGEDPEPAAEDFDDQEIDSISIKRDHCLSDIQSPKVKHRQRKRRKTDKMYRKSCPEMLLLHKLVIKPDTAERSVFSESKNLENLASQGKEISLKLHGTDDERKQEVRKHLKQITNLPLGRYPWSIPDLVVWPGRRKKNDRPVERRPQRGQAQGPSIPAQPTDEDPAPPTIHNLSSDRYALPTQPENRNLQHLLSSFTPRVEPISASTQQLRRLSSRPRHQQYADEAARRASFASWPSNTGQNAENMITNGFFYTGRVDLIRCYMCGIGLKDWSADDEPLFEHVRHSPDCPFLFTFLGQDVLDAYKAALLPGRAQPTGARDSSQGATNRPEGVAIASAESSIAPVRNPDYADLRQRVDSFSAWPRDVTQTPRQLAEAGFFHTGDGDTVRCFQCDGGLRRWDPRDDPWIEHTRWFPHCQYVRQQKGVEYVELVQRAIRESAGEDEEPYDEAAGAMANLTVNPELSSEPQEPPVTPQTILDMGYSREALSKAMDIANQKGMVNYTPQDLLEILLEMQTEGQLTALEPRPQATQETPKGATSSQETEDDPLFVTIENKSLKKVLKCSECKIRDKNILFLPCTHHVLCEQCAEAATKCPVCEHDIDRKIKTYLS